VVVPADDDDDDALAAPNDAEDGAVRAADANVRHGADADDATLQEVPPPPPTPTRTAVAPARTAGATSRASGRRPMMTLIGTGPARDEEDEDDGSVTGKARLAILMPPEAASRVAKPSRSPAAPAPSAAPSPPPMKPGAAPPSAAKLAAPVDDDDEDGDATAVQTLLAPALRVPVLAPSPAKPTPHKIRVPARPPAPTLLDPRTEPDTPLFTLGPAARAEDEPDSVTAQAPGVGNALRNKGKSGSALASKAAAAPDAAAPGTWPNAEDDDDDPPENQTAVMLGGPYGAASGSLAAATPGSLARAPLPTPDKPYVPVSARSSASRDTANAAPVSEGALRAGAPQANLDSFGAIRGQVPDPRALAPTAYDPRADVGSAISAGPPAKPPRYGAIVAFTALVSVLVPFAVFYVLRSRAEIAGTREPTTRTSEVVRLAEGARGKASGRPATGKRR
jgi:hypothetical protein